MIKILLQIWLSIVMLNVCAGTISSAEPDQKPVLTTEVTRLESQSSIRCIAISKDGRFAVSGGGNYRDEKFVDCVVRLWDLQTMKETGHFEGHEQPVRSLAFLPNGNHIISGSDDRTLRLWDVNTKRELSSWRAHDLVLGGSAIAPNGKLIATGGQDRDPDKNLCIWNVSTAKEAYRLSSDRLPVSCVAFSPDGKQLLSGSGKTAWLWDTSTEKEILHISGHDRNVNAIAFSPDGKHVFTGCEGRFSESEVVQVDNPVYVWDAATGKEVRRLHGHTATIAYIVVALDGKRALSCGGSVTSKDGRKVPVDCVIRLWDLATGKLIRTYSGHDSWVSAVAFMPDGKHLISASWDRTIRIWRLPD